MISSCVGNIKEHLFLSFFICSRKNFCTKLLWFTPIIPASTDDGKFLLAARKCRRPTCTDYIISLNSDDVSKGSSTYVGKLRYIYSISDIRTQVIDHCRHEFVISFFLYCRSNFLGTKFTIYDAQPPNTGAKVTKCRSTRLVNMKQVSPRVPAGNYPVAHISYELNVLGSRYIKMFLKLP